MRKLFDCYKKSIIIKILTQTLYKCTQTREKLLVNNKISQFHTSILYEHLIPNNNDRSTESRKTRGHVDRRFSRKKEDHVFVQIKKKIAGDFD